MGGEVGGQQVASWTDSWDPRYGGQGLNNIFHMVKCNKEKSLQLQGPTHMVTMVK